MDELLQLIIELPFPALTNKEWDVFEDIFSSLSEKSAIGFSNKWKEELAQCNSAPITSVKPEILFAYLDKWIRMANFLMKYNRWIATSWLELTKNEIDADALLDISVELLPNNLSDLKLILTSIDKASFLDRQNGVGFALTTLYIAVSAKIQQLESNKLLLEKGNYADKINATIHLLKQKNQIRELLSLCENFQEYLESKVELIIRDNDSLGYHYYYNNAPRQPKQAIIPKMLSSLDFECQNIPCKEQVLPIIKRYLLLQDFIFTLKRSKYSPHEKLIEFSEKFSNFEAYISNPANSASLLIKPINEFISFFNFFRYSQEEEFFRRIKSIAETIKKEAYSPVPERSGWQ